jgi:hypothetical protein
MGDSAMHGRMNIDLFKNTMLEDRNSSLFEQYADAVHLSLYEQPCEKRLVEKSVGNEEFVSEIIAMFPDAKFLHVLRNPYSNLVSLRHYAMRENRGYPRLMPLMQAIESSYYFLLKNLGLVENYLPVPYERILEFPEITMQIVSRFLNIEFKDSLLSPSSLGDFWSGNSSRGIEFTGINKDNMSRWEKEVNALEIAYVNKAIPFVFDMFRYNQIDTRRYLKPMAKESPLMYLTNRIQLALSWRRGE